MPLAQVSEAHVEVLENRHPAFRGLVVDVQVFPETLDRQERADLVWQQVGKLFE
jgi:hypothetical protein